MIQLQKLSKTISTVVVAIAFIATVLLLALYVLHFGRSDFSSDDAVLSLQAESIWKQGSLFPAGWVGNNGDLMMPSGALLLAPLLAWFPNSYGLHAVAGIFSIVLLLGTFSAFLLRAKLPLPVVLVATTVLASGLSRISAMMLFLQTTYVWWPSAFLVGATLIWREREARSNGAAPSRLRVAALATVVFLIAFANPGRALLMVVFPLYVFDRILSLRLNPVSRSGTGSILERLGLRDLLVIFGLGAGFSLAAITYYGLFEVGIVRTIHNTSNLRWEGLPGLTKHWEIFQVGWFNYLGGLREINAPESALENVLRPLRLAFAIWLSWVGVAEVIKSFRSHDPLRSALAMAFAAAFVPLLVLYSAFAPLAIDVGTIRYFTVPIVMLLAMAAFRVSGASSWIRWLGHPLSVVFSCFIVLASAVRFVPAVSQDGLRFLDLRDSFASRISGLLEKEKLVWGYATWWNAGVVTILSSERVRINPVEFSDTNIRLFPYLTQQSDYTPEARVGETFLLLRPGEADVARTSAMRAILGEPSRVVESQDAFIYVYPENISAYFCHAGAEMNSKLVPQPVHGQVLQVYRNERSEVAGVETIAVTLRNNGSEILGGTGRYPISIGIQLLDGRGTLVDRDWVHYSLPCAVRPGEQRVFVIELPKMPIEARVGKVGLLQEGVAWFEQWGIEPVLLPLDGTQNDKISIKSFDP